MPDSPALDHARDLNRLAELASQPEALRDVMRGALASLRDVISYDLAVIYELRGARLTALAAEGPLADDRVRAHQLELAAHPTIRRALELRRPIPLEEHHHHSDEGDPYDGVLDLPPGHSCMVVPLFAADRGLGIITLDRTTCGVYRQDAVQLAGVYGQIVSLAMMFAAQARALARLRAQLQGENQLLQQEVGSSDWAIEQLERSASPAMQALVRTARQVALANLPVLIQGETGSGKEVLAKALHAWSARARAPFVKLNCAALPENLIESELFGHVRGAFSGAARERRGRFQIAHRGTLLLDEIGDMSLSAQSMLLRVLQEGAFEPVGSDKTVHVDVRVIAASHVDLRDAAAAGDFREDLYYRLAGFPLTIPPLRARLQDLDHLTRDILVDIARRTGRGPWTVSPPALALLRAHDWPGNVRELVNALERATILCGHGTIERRHVSFLASARGPRGDQAAAPRDDLAVDAPDRGGPFPSFDDAQRAYFTRALARVDGKIYGPDGAATLVGLKPTTLQSRLKKLGLAGARRRGGRGRA